MTESEKKRHRRARRYLARAFGRKVAGRVGPLSLSEIEEVESSRERQRVREKRRAMWIKVLAEEGASLIRRVVERLAALPGASLWDSL